LSPENIVSIFLRLRSC